MMDLLGGVDGDHVMDGDQSRVTSLNNYIRFLIAHLHRGSTWSTQSMDVRERKYDTYTAVTKQYGIFALTNKTNINKQDKH